MNLLKNLLLFLRDQRGWTSEMTVTGISAIDAAIPNFWGDDIIPDGDRQSFWGGLSGKEGSRMPLIDKTGPLKKKGDQITFNTLAQLMGTGVTGESVLKGKEEKLAIGTFTVGADIVRHAVAVSEKSTLQANFAEVNRAKSLLTEWMGRKRDADVFTTILDSSNVDTLYAHSKGSVGELNETDADFFTAAEIELMRMALIRQGATPLSTKKSNGRIIPVYGLVFGEIEDYRLNQNTAFVNAIKESWVRFKEGSTHPLFSGVVGMYRNMLLYPFYSLLPIPQGTPLRPETIVYTTLTAGATTLTVGTAIPSGSSITPDFTAFFASSGSLQVEDEILSYTDKTNDTFSGLSRGVSSTTAASHAQNKLVTQRNVASIIGFGAEAVYRANCQSPTPIGEKDDFGAQIGLGIKAYYGQAIRTDQRRAKCPSLVKCKCYSENPGTI